MLTFPQRAYFGVLLAVHYVAALVTVPMLAALERQDSYSVLLSLLLGIGAGQILLLGLWLATVQLPLLTRGVGVSLAGAGLFLAWAIGSRAAQQGITIPIESGMLAFVSISFAAMIVAGLMRGIAPLRDNRIYIGYLPASSARQFRLQQLFAWIALVAMLLAAGRLVPWEGSYQFEYFPIAASIAFAQVGVAIFTFVEFLILLPVIRVCFSSKGEQYRVADMFVAPVLMALFVVLLVAFLTLLMTHRVDESLMRMTAIVFPFHLAELLTVSVTLFVLRQIGFRLKREYRPYSRDHH